MLLAGASMRARCAAALRCTAARPVCVYCLRECMRMRRCPHLKHKACGGEGDDDDHGPADDGCQRGRLRVREQREDGSPVVRKPARMCACVRVVCVWGGGGMRIIQSVALAFPFSSCRGRLRAISHHAVLACAAVRGMHGCVWHACTAVCGLTHALGR